MATGEFRRLVALRNGEVRIGTMTLNQGRELQRGDCVICGANEEPLGASGPAVGASAGLTPRPVFASRIRFPSVPRYGWEPRVR